MRYTVIWTPRALATLANIWTQTTDRQAVTHASNRIDVVLRDDPDSKGKPVGKSFSRVEAPLAILNRVDPGDRMVHVYHVKWI
jgi:hypothetical protein